MWSSGSPQVLRLSNCSQNIHPENSSKSVPQPVQHIVNEWKRIVILYGGGIQLPIVYADSPSSHNPSAY